LFERAQVPLGVRQAALAEFSDGRAMLNRRQHVLQRHPLGDVIVDVSSRHEWHAAGAR
jgi:hypothetical protein